MWNPRVSGWGAAKLSTAFDVIRRFILLFAWDMPEIGFIGTAVSTFPSMCDSPHLRAGCTLKHGSGSLMDPMSTQYSVFLTVTDPSIFLRQGVCNLGG